MQYFRAYRFLFESPKWATHLLIGAVCQLVPLAGHLVLTGYLYSVVEAKHRFGDQEFPAFDFDRLGAYLVRGFWPFAVSLVAVLPLVMLGMLMMLPIVLSVVSAQPPNEPPVFIFALFALTFAAFMILMFAAQVLIVPLVLRAGLAQDFVSAFSIQFFRDFFGRVWPEALLSMLFFLVTAPVVILAGFLV
jgi:hypothetical protein